MDTDINQLIIQERLRNTHNSFQHPSYLLEQRISKAIATGDSKTALSALDQINSLERAQLAENPLRSIKNSLIGSCTIFTRACISGGVDSETAFMLSDLYIRRIEDLKTRTQAESLEYDMVIGFTDLVTQHHHPRLSPPVYKAYQYIRHNVQKRLTLGDVARHVGVHPNYLSSLFTAETGQSIMSFYDQQRCEVIKQFLINTDISLTDISVNFDFSSISYFSSYFKKQTGDTPSEFRRRAQVAD